MGTPMTDLRNEAGECASEVSKLVVATLSFFTGRGPEAISTRFGVDFVVVIVRGAMTKPEQVLLREGHGPMVLELRRTLEQLMASTLIEGVEAITGRSVDSLLSANQLDPDIAVETFLLGAAQATGLTAATSRPRSPASTG